MGRCTILIISAILFAGCCHHHQHEVCRPVGYSQGFYCSGYSCYNYGYRNLGYTCYGRDPDWRCHNNTETKARFSASYPRATITIIPATSRQNYTFIIDEESVDAIADGITIWKEQKNEFHSKESSR